MADNNSWFIAGLLAGLGIGALVTWAVVQIAKGREEAGIIYQYNDKGQLTGIFKAQMPK